MLGSKLVQVSFKKKEFWIQSQT